MTVILRLGYDCAAAPERQRAVRIAAAMALRKRCLRAGTQAFTRTSRYVVRSEDSTLTAGVSGIADGPLQHGIGSAGCAVARPDHVLVRADKYEAGFVDLATAASRVAHN